MKLRQRGRLTDAGRHTHKKENTTECKERSRKGTATRRNIQGERERDTENERAESRGSQAFCGLARLKRWDLAGCGPLASLLKLGRKKNHSQKMKRAKSYAKNAQARSNTLGSFLLPAFLFPRAGLNNRWDQSREPTLHLEPR